MHIFISLQESDIIKEVDIILNQYWLPFIYLNKTPYQYISTTKHDVIKSLVIF